MNNEYPGFDEFMSRMDKDTLDNLGQLIAMQIAYQAGRRYQAERDAEALRKLNVVALRKQA